jgi:hypothetical protein
VSAGPIQQARDASTVPPVSTPDVHRVCALVAETKTAYCGRTSSKQRTTDWEEVTCADCRAAGRADGLQVPVEITNTGRGA